MSFFWLHKKTHKLILFSIILTISSNSSASYFLLGGVESKTSKISYLSYYYSTPLLSQDFATKHTDTDSFTEQDSSTDIWGFLIEYEKITQDSIDTNIFSVGGELNHAEWGYGMNIILNQNSSQFTLGLDLFANRYLTDYLNLTFHLKGDTSLSMQSLRSGGKGKMSTSSSTSSSGTLLDYSVKTAISYDINQKFKIGLGYEKFWYTSDYYATTQAASYMRNFFSNTDQYDYKSDFRLNYDLTSNLNLTLAWYQEKALETLSITDTYGVQTAYSFNSNWIGRIEFTKTPSPSNEGQYLEIEYYY